MLIREINGGDCRAVVSLWNECLHRDPMTEARFGGWLYGDTDFDTENGKGAWVALDGGRVVGFVRAIHREMPNDRLGTERERGWIPAVFVSPALRRAGIGTELLGRATGWLRERGAKQAWVCGNSGSAPGYVFPGVDAEAYAPAVALFRKCGFVVDRTAVSMTTPLLDYDPGKYARPDAGEGLAIESLTPGTVMEFFSFLRRCFPGDWNTAARNKVKAGDYSRILVAVGSAGVVGYCQWEDDGHFGPFGVDASTRGLGVGAMLFLEACRRLKQCGAREVWFNWADPDAARFYRRLGLSPVRTFEVMRKEL